MTPTVLESKFQPTPASIPPPGALNTQLQQPQNLPVHIQPLNPLSFLLRAAQIYPKKLAIAHSDVQHPVFYTYANFAQRVQNLAYALIQAGIQPGDRVAIIAPNCPVIAEAHHGVMAARAVLCPINTRLTVPEVSYILEHSGSKLIIVDHEYKNLTEKSNLPIVVSNDTGRQGDPYEEFLNQGRRFSQERGWPGLEWEADENAGAALCYTSGTTGRPKGVLTTLRGSYLAGLANAYETRMTPESVYLWILPMFHASGWTFPWAITASFATQITLRTVDPTKIWYHFMHSGVTHYCGAPTVQISLVNAPEAQAVPQKIAAIIAGSAPTAQLLGELEKKGIEPIHVYGLTETYGPFTRAYAQPEWKYLPLDERARYLARQGFSFLTSDPVRVVYQPKEGDNSELVDVPNDGKTLGEIVMRGNIAMKEYFRDPEATKKAFQGGYFHTGDLAVVQPDGYVAIQDRSKDIIISGGENASSLAIEQELASHQDVLEVSVVARAHPKWGERPMAFVILRTEVKRKWDGRQQAFEAELKKHARSRLPGFACPEWVEVVEDLPKTSTGKIQKVVLRQRVAKL
ncbi:acetyl-CoA synthetase-like protein [Cytidiella melzeri]|nr:acetyl-CoA synthetase-like protein [Cytidiella melzeri]